ncbi:MAG: phosphate propanoyltransferase [Ignavibacteriaceae bacterium]
MSLTKEYTANKQLDKISDQKLIELIVNEVQNFLKADLRSINSHPGLNSPFVNIPLGISNRHIHLTPKTFHMLFGEETECESMRPLYQLGEFASKQLLTIVGPKLRSIPNVRILGPLRKYDQVEVSLTDAIFLGIDPPVANSGSLGEAAPLTLVGPNGSIYLEKCAIVANRHIHMSNIDAELLGVKNGDYCKVKITGEKSTVFENVLIRTNDNWKLQIHLDTDDANAANVREETSVEFMGKI